MKIYIIPTSQTEYLAKKIQKKTKETGVIFPNLDKRKRRHFPDGEIYMKILKAGRIRDGQVIVLHSGASRPNEGLIELELVLQILRDYKINPEVFFTYFPYGTQDKVFEKGETNVAENLIEKLIKYYKVRRIYIIDPHFGGRKWVKKYPITSLSAIPLLIKEAKKNYGENILFLSPDTGGKRRTGILGIKKERLTSFNVRMLSPTLNFKGRVVGVIDDMIKTGGTLLKFQKIAKNGEAQKVIALVTHGVIPSGVLKIKKKYSKLYLTNTIRQKWANVDITNLILKAIAKI